MSTSKPSQMTTQTPRRHFSFVCVPYSCRIWGSHSDEYKCCSVQGHNALLLYINRKVRANRARGYNWATLFLGDINTGDLALQDGGVSDETVMYGYWPSVTGLDM
jgi:hypothetical protein